MSDDVEVFEEFDAASEAGVLLRDCYDGMAGEGEGLSRGFGRASEAFARLCREMAGEWRDAIDLLIAENRLNAADRLKRDTRLFDEVSRQVEEQQGGAVGGADGTALMHFECGFAEELYSCKEQVSLFLDAMVEDSLSPPRFVSDLKDVEDLLGRLRQRIGERRGFIENG